jgi:peroxiredoxin
MLFLQTLWDNTYKELLRAYMIKIQANRFYVKPLALWTLIIVVVTAMDMVIMSFAATAASPSTTKMKPSRALWVGEVAPFVSLLLVTSVGNKPWHSGDLLGHKAIVYLLIPSRCSMKAWRQILPSTASSETTDFYVVVQRKSNVPERNFGLAKPWRLLVDDHQTLISQYAPPIEKPIAVVIDKAGFLRMAQPVTSSADWQKVMTLEKSISSRPFTSSIQVGKKAPDFIMKDMNGTGRSLHQLRGKSHLLLTFFPKCFTFTCGMQLSSLRDSQQALEAKHLEIWGVSVDEASGARGQKTFAGYLHLNFPLLPDPGHQLCLLYGSVLSTDQMSSRMSVLIDKNGIVRWIDKQIDPRHYGDDVLAKMRELGMN